MAQLFNVKLSRYDSTPWGFRLQGGKDFGTPLIIQKVTAGSLAEKAGLAAGDAVLRINGTDATVLRHKEAQDQIVRAGNNFELAVQRGGVGSSTWKPHVSPVGPSPVHKSPISKAPAPVTKTSLAYRGPQSKPIGTGHNVSAKPFASQPHLNGSSEPKLVNKQYNSPIGIYSEQSIAETLSAQAEVLAGGVLGVNFKKNEKDYNAANSEVFKMVQEADKEPRTPEPERPLSALYYATHSHAVGGRATSPCPRPTTPSNRAYTGTPPPNAPGSNAPLNPAPMAPTKSVAAPSLSTSSTPASFSGLPVASDTPKCAECDRFIVISKCDRLHNGYRYDLAPAAGRIRRSWGVFVRIKEKNLHVECFKCATCGSSLKNVGYYNINNKLYCDIHAKMVARQQAPAPGLEPVTVPPGHRPPAGTILSALANSGATAPLSPLSASTTSYGGPQSPGLGSPQPGTIAPLPFHTPTNISGPRPFSTQTSNFASRPAPDEPESVGGGGGEDHAVQWPPAPDPDQGDLHATACPIYVPPPDLPSSAFSPVGKVSHEQLRRRSPPKSAWLHAGPPETQKKLSLCSREVQALSALSEKLATQMMVETLSRPASPVPDHGHDREINVGLPSRATPVCAETDDKLLVPGSPRCVHGLSPEIRPPTPGQIVVFPPEVPVEVPPRPQSRAADFLSSTLPHWRAITTPTPSWKVKEQQEHRHDELYFTPETENNERTCSRPSPNPQRDNSNASQTQRNGEKDVVNIFDNNQTPSWGGPQAQFEAQDSQTRSYNEDGPGGSTIRVEESAMSSIRAESSASLIESSQLIQTSDRGEKDQMMYRATASPIHFTIYDGDGSTKVAELDLANQTTACEIVETVVTTREICAGDSQEKSSWEGESGKRTLKKTNVCDRPSSFCPGDTEWYCHENVEQCCRKDTQSDRRCVGDDSCCQKRTEICRRNICCRETSCGDSRCCQREVEYCCQRPCCCQKRVRCCCRRCTAQQTCYDSCSYRRPCSRSGRASAPKLSASPCHHFPGRPASAREICERATPVEEVPCIKVSKSDKPRLGYSAESRQRTIPIVVTSKPSTENQKTDAPEQPCKNAEEVRQQPVQQRPRAVSPVLAAHRAEPPFTANIAVTNPRIQTTPPLAPPPPPPVQSLALPPESRWVLTEAQRRQQQHQQLQEKILMAQQQMKKKSAAKAAAAPDPPPQPTPPKLPSLASLLTVAPERPFSPLPTPIATIRTEVVPLPEDKAPYRPAESTPPPPRPHTPRSVSPIHGAQRCISPFLRDLAVHAIESSSRPNTPYSREQQDADKRTVHECQQEHPPPRKPSRGGGEEDAPRLEVRSDAPRGQMSQMLYALTIAPDRPYSPFQLSRPVSCVPDEGTLVDIPASNEPYVPFVVDLPPPPPPAQSQSPIRRHFDVYVPRSPRPRVDPSPPPTYEACQMITTEASTAMQQEHQVCQFIKCNDGRSPYLRQEALPGSVPWRTSSDQPRKKEQESEEEERKREQEDAWKAREKERKASEKRREEETRRAQEKQRREEEEKERREEKEKQQKEEKLRREAQERQQREAEERQRREAEERQRREAEENRKREAEEKQRKEALEKQREEEEKRKREDERNTTPQKSALAGRAAVFGHQGLRAAPPSFSRERSGEASIPRRRDSIGSGPSGGGPADFSLTSDRSSTTSPCDVSRARRVSEPCRRSCVTPPSIAPRQCYTPRKQSPLVTSFPPAPIPAPTHEKPPTGALPNAGGAGGASKGGVFAGASAPTRGRGILNPATSGARIPLCGSCNQYIRGPFITALGRIWCPNHFVCANGRCNRPLQDIGFVEEKGQLYCEFCFEQYIAPPCGKCGHKIKGDCLNAISKHFHPECFNCVHCGKLFGNSPFFLEDGHPYCETDWNELFTTKCFACGFPIEAGDRWVEALQNNYHSQCFNCTMCKKNLEGESFFAKGGRPFCRNHAR